MQCFKGYTDIPRVRLWNPRNVFLAAMLSPLKIEFIAGIEFFAGDGFIASQMSSSLLRDLRCSQLQQPIPGSQNASRSVCAHAWRMLLSPVAFTLETKA